MGPGTPLTPGTPLWTDTPLGPDSRDQAPPRTSPPGTMEPPEPGTPLEQAPPEPWSPQNQALPWSRHPRDQVPPCAQTHTCKHITLPQTVNNHFVSTLVFVTFWKGVRTLPPEYPAGKVNKKGWKFESFYFFKSVQLGRCPVNPEINDSDLKCALSTFKYIGGSKRGASDAAPPGGPISFNLMQFLFKNWLSNRFFRVDAATNLNRLVIGIEIPSALWNFYWFHLQHYSQSRRPHGSRPFHDFHWYNSWNSHKPWMEPVVGMTPGGCSSRQFFGSGR